MVVLEVPDQLSQIIDNPFTFAWSINMTEYQELLPKMRNVEERLRLIKDVEIKTELESRYQRFKHLQPKCSKQMIIYETFSNARDVKDEAMKAFVKADKELTELKAKEKQLAALISDDHIMADESGQSLTSLFPNVHGKMVLRTEVLVSIG